ncbi:oxidoreductase [Rhodococcoides fascians]|uniref:molybdopterin-dependent oxidoreductase n=1 Tax=Rhodococcoides fascians TaxID=1828 RepID=UPI000B9B25F0|nr:molybdopterin-dependent oxidoreductase [Rhodococcus fascians]OZE90083.1 oxidoreductase [Rhodococcus fascians]OZF18389.1 oxidoreductase [Rhodococcus fascians]OZF22399.1 oxidoreductase [Rhodococcus fascians]OZF67948.1 oxidoreductase [Rhodococcus fascians]OZF71295.1 oxidoreductase [Rhodococcus fascians]
MPIDEPKIAGSPVGRRVVLGLVAAGVAGIVGGGAVQKGLASVLGPLGNHDPTGLIGLIPVGDNFRFYSVTQGAPRKDENSYALTVGGSVDTPRTFTLQDLRAMPQTSLVRDFQCVTGWRVPEVAWSGVRLADILDAVGPTASATSLRFTSFDGTYTESLTLEQARRDDVLVALTMLDGPVTHDHGGPVRLFVASMYGYKSIKWLGGIELTDNVVPGYWEKRGYDIDAYVGESNGRRDDPTS